MEYNYINQELSLNVNNKKLKKTGSILENYFLKQYKHHPEKFGHAPKLISVK